MYLMCVTLDFEISYSQCIYVSNISLGKVKQYTLISKKMTYFHVFPNGALDVTNFYRKNS